MNLWRPIDTLIDQITMYRLMIYYLVFLVVAGMGLSLFGNLHFGWWALLISTSTLVLACWGLNKVFGWFFRAPINNESPLITAGILALIITPDMSLTGIGFLLAAGVLATASKYLLAIRQKHIFNPAALAVLLTSLAANQTPTWWVGSAVMLPFVLVGGLLIVRKVRRIRMIVTFLLATSLATAGLAYLGGGDPLVSLKDMALSSAVFFLAFVMLTEPQTSPTAPGNQLVYASLVGALVPPQVHFLGYYSSPEVALIIGNTFSYIVNPKTKLFPVLTAKLQIAKDTMEFSFTSNRPFNYRAGQYIELTLPHAHKDSRGERRYFTLASSPTEPNLRIGVKFYQPSSSFKRALAAVTPQSPMAMGQVAGDFTLPANKQQKLAFIAGGIGITPFRSMVKYLVDTKDARDAVLLFTARSQADVAYAPLFEEARRAIGLRTTYILTDDTNGKPSPNTLNGQRLTAELIAKLVPDYRERLFYLSGTHPMVSDIKTQLRHLGVPSRQIKIDFFPGYA